MANQPTTGWTPLPLPRYNARNLELGVRDMDGLIANLHQLDEALQDAARQVMADGGHSMYELAFLLCPKDTEFMCNHLTLTPAPSGLGFELGWDATDFFDAGFAFYPFFQEFGTVHHVPQPSVGPAFEMVAPEIKDNLGDALRDAAERRRQ